MKKILFFASTLIFSVAAMAQNNAKTDDIVKFATEKHDFGKIKQGVPVNFSFEFKNISNKPVVVENASATCGCTVPEKPEKPILPGETGKIKVQFNAANVQPFTKEVYIKFAGVDQQKTVHITGEVVAATDNSSAKKTKQ